jgi:branched-chain amino acid transport system ATP-binding protein
MLQLERVSLSYGSFRALDNITLNAGAGELVVLLGANGAGKSSIFLAMSGIHRVSGGSMRFEGRELAQMTPSQIVQAGLIHCPEGRKLFPAMSVQKNLTLGAYVHRRDSAGIKASLEEVFEMFPILRQKKDDAAGSLSGGQQQMVALGRALMGRPRALLLDEPSLGLAPLVVKQMFDVIQRINRAGTTVLRRAERVCRARHRAPRVRDRERTHRDGRRSRLAAQGRRHPPRVHRRVIGLHAVYPPGLRACTGLTASPRAARSARGHETMAVQIKTGD